MPPANDNYSSRATLAGDDGSASFDLTGATLEAGESPPYSTDQGTVWFTWTPTLSGTARIDSILTAGNPDTAAAVYVDGGSIAASTYIAQDDDSGAGLASPPGPYGAFRLTWTVVAGTAYAIQVSAYEPVTAGVLTWTMVDVYTTGPWTDPGDVVVVGDPGSPFASSLRMAIEGYSRWQIFQNLFSTHAVPHDSSYRTDAYHRAIGGESNDQPDVDGFGVRVNYRDASGSGVINKGHGNLAAWQVGQVGFAGERIRFSDVSSGYGMFYEVTAVRAVFAGDASGFVTQFDYLHTPPPGGSIEWAPKAGDSRGGLTEILKAELQPTIVVQDSPDDGTGSGTGVNGDSWQGIPAAGFALQLTTNFMTPGGYLTTTPPFPTQANDFQPEPGDQGAATVLGSSTIAAGTTAGETTLSAWWDITAAYLETIAGGFLTTSRVVMNVTTDRLAAARDAGNPGSGVGDIRSTAGLKAAAWRWTLRAHSMYRVTTSAPYVSMPLIAPPLRMGQRQDFRGGGGPRQSRVNTRQASVRAGNGSVL